MTEPAIDHPLPGGLDQAGDLAAHAEVQVGDTGPFVAERGHGHLPAPVQWAEHRGSGNAHVIEKYFREVVLPGQGGEGPGGNAGQAHIDQQAGNALVFR